MNFEKNSWNNESSPGRALNGKATVYMICTYEHLSITHPKGLGNEIGGVVVRFLVWFYLSFSLCMSAQYTVS